MRGPRRLGLYRLDDGRMTVAEQQRTVARPVVDEPMTVHVPLVCPRGPVDIDGERLQMTQVVRHAIGEDGSRLLVQLARNRELRREPFRQGLCKDRGHNYSQGSQKKIIDHQSAWPSTARLANTFGSPRC